MNQYIDVRLALSIATGIIAAGVISSLVKWLAGPPLAHDPRRRHRVGAAVGSRRLSSVEE